MRHPRISLLLGGLVAGLLAVTTAPVLVAPAAAGPADDYARAAVTATNQERVERGRVRLKGNACLKHFAVQQASRMARRQQAFHQTLRPVLYRCGLRRAGENVAAGYRTGWSVVRDGWMRSPDHRANIVDRRFRLMAVAARMGDDRRWYAAQLFGRR